VTVIGLLLFRESPVIVIGVLPPGPDTAWCRWMTVSTLLPGPSGTPWSATNPEYASEPVPKKFAGMGEPPKSWNVSPFAAVSNSSLPAPTGNEFGAAVLFAVTNKATTSAIPTRSAMPSMTGFV